ncbi:hypothetical protein HYT17_00545 [Candidatus Microgenomates bacterium]|nr:hypothetical protein [Candidatus Microgenomates bacterium]
MLSTAFAPANVSLLFTIEEHKNPAKMGSCGFGFTVDGGITAAVVRNSSKNEVYFNNVLISFPSVTTVLDNLGVKPLKVRLLSGLPLGSGFGLSGAAALATAYAVNQLLNLKKSNLELAKIAHAADVSNKTGLGDVASQYFGGFCIKTQSSAQFIIAKKLPFEGKTVYYRIFRPLATKSIITDKTRKQLINRIGRKIVAQVAVMTKPTLAQVFNKGFQFAKEANLLSDQEVIKLIEEIRNGGGAATMIMLGHGVLSDVPFEKAAKITISDKGAHLL